MDRRRQSYASVVGGSPSSATPPPPSTRFGQLTHVMNHPSSSSNYAQTQDSETRAHTSRNSYIEEGVKSSPSPWSKGVGIQHNWSQGGLSGTYRNENLGNNMLIRPSYLRGSRYLERLEAVHKAKQNSQRDFLSSSPYGSGQASLSTSSSSVSLQRMAPSHRGMTYEIVEHQPPPDDDGGVAPLPSKWAEVDKYGGLEVSPDGLDIRYSGQLKSQEHEAAAARTDHPMPPQCGLYYYEVALISKGKEG